MFKLVSTEKYIKMNLFLSGILGIPPKKQKLIHTLHQIQESQRWPTFDLNRAAFTFDRLVNLPQLSSEFVHLQQQYVEERAWELLSYLKSILLDLDGVLQCLSQKVVIVRNLGIQIMGMKRTLNLFLLHTARSFAVLNLK